ANPGAESQAGHRRVSPGARTEALGRKDAHHAHRPGFQFPGAASAQVWKETADPANTAECAQCAGEGPATDWQLPWSCRGGFDPQTQPAVAGLGQLPSTRGLQANVRPRGPLPEEAALALGASEP